MHTHTTHEHNCREPQTILSYLQLVNGLELVVVNIVDIILQSCLLLGRLFHAENGVVGRSEQLLSLDGA